MDFLTSVWCCCMVLVVLVFLLIIFYQLRGTMGELCENLKKVYAKWEAKAQPSAQMPSVTSPKQKCFRGRGRGRNGLNAPSMRGSWRITTSSLLNSSNFLVGDFKVDPVVLPTLTSKRPYMGRCCEKCLPFSKVSLVNEVTKQLGYRNLLYVPTLNEENNFLIRKFAYIIHVIKTKITGNPDITKSVLQDERVLQAIEQTVKKNIKDNGLDENLLDLEVKKQLHKVLHLLVKMKANIMSAAVRFCTWVFYKLMCGAYISVQVNQGQIQVLKKASESNIPMIYLPLHRSHLDYTLITFAAWTCGIQMPLVAAGENLAFPIIGSILSWHGGFFIKRKWDSKDGSDHIYRAVLHSFLQNNLMNKKDLEFFVEGRRTRTGRPLLPKAGLMSLVMKIYLSGSIPDVNIVPVSINYDKLMEENFISEEMGYSKKPENVWLTIKSIWNLWRGKYGMTRLEFGQPFSLREFVETTKVHYRRQNHFLTSQGVSSPMCLSGMVTPDVDEDKDLSRYLVSNLLKHVVYDATQCTAIMSTNMIAFLLVNKFRQGTTLSHLITNMEWLKEEIFVRGRDVGFSGSMTDVVKNAFSFWGHDFVRLKKLDSTETVDSFLVDGQCEEDDMFVMPVVSLPNVHELSYYSNYLTSVFLMESIVANTVYSLIDMDPNLLVDCDSHLTISRQLLQDKAELLCDIMKFEFIFAPPCTSRSSVIIQTIDKFVESGLLTSLFKYTTNLNLKEDEEQPVKTHRWHDSGSDSDDELFQDEKFMVDVAKQSVEQLDFLRNILSPILESYWLVASCLDLLLDQPQMEEREFLKETRSYIRSQINFGLVLHEESFSANTLQNALKLFGDWKVLEIHTEDKFRILNLTDKYNDIQQLGKILHTLNQFKK